MEDKSAQNRSDSGETHLTVREIRGLLTRLGAELVRSLGQGPAPKPLRETARPVEPRRFIRSMSPFLRMN